MTEPHLDPTEAAYWMVMASVCTVIQDPHERMVAIAEELADAYMEGSDSGWKKAWKEVTGDQI